ncbi:beta strand repeat-containing protein [Paludisphaera borealis]|uniref:beta strand repeat-containing protein n=1 Tax=Paludisphaera borealis TaxID=1387353 RepID=UPI001F450D62|nr:right-handed parallel beta-helix repeat-containing protein [Paludisphaera borealis]
MEVLEDRQLMATFTVTNLGDSGTGSLRQAIIAANAQPGPDTIDFGVAGVIRVGRTSLPSITDSVAINGGSAPTFAGAPVVTVDFHGTKGFNFANGADGSSLSSLSLVSAGNAGVTLNASHVTVQGNYIGLRADGSSVAGNRGDGIQINASSHDNLIGRSDPVSSISYYNASAVSMQPVSGWQGLRGTSVSGQYLIAGTSSANGLLYVGPITGVGGASFSVNYPGATSTSVYGPDDLGNGVVRLVGSYKTGDDMVNGFLYEGTTAGLSNAANYRTIDYPGAKFNYVHSTMGGLAVGNADGPEGNLPIGTGHAFMYDVVHNTFLPDIVYPGSTSTTAYGIWYNGGTSYTIVGGYTTLAPGGGVGHGYIVDYDSATGQYTNWTSLDYPNGAAGKTYETHFEGISSVEKGVYTLAADSIQTGSSNTTQGSLVTIRRNTDGSFGPNSWVDLNFPGVNGWTSNDAVMGNQAVGIVIGDTGEFSYQATVNTEFQLSNVISGNCGNGIGIYGSNDNRIAMNNIGTNAAGTLARANAKNGILVTNGAARNLIGGQATNGNDPTAGVFSRPPQGNLISGNRGNGVLINKGATQNTLSGNFVGTTASGNLALGNGQDGVAIDGANGNQLIGCTFQQDPFVFYNVISGNRGNGLRINNSNDTTVQANFLGVGANNASVVANGGDGLLISGSSRNTQVGGVIPLGNVISGNNRNGIEVRDKASGFVSFNTFAGVFAFGSAAPNRQDGILITSTGGNNVIRTCIVSGNLGDGIEIGGNATGVQVTETAVGTNTKIQYAIPNGGSGIKISGRAHGNSIGGFQPSIEPQVTISSNRRYGVEIVGSAYDNAIFHTYIGTNSNGTAALGNDLGGILLGAGTRSTTVGGFSAPYQNKILNSGGNGVTIQSSKSNLVQGNQISGSQGWGLFAQGVCTATVVNGNVIQTNALGNVNLTNSKGVVYTS